MSGNIGALDLEKTAAELETAVRQETTSGLEKLLNQFDKALDMVLVSIRSAVGVDFTREEELSQKPVVDVAACCFCNVDWLKCVEEWR